MNKTASKIVSLVLAMVLLASCTPAAPSDGDGTPADVVSVPWQNVIIIDDEERYNNDPEYRAKVDAQRAEEEARARAATPHGRLKTLGIITEDYEDTALMTRGHTVKSLVRLTGGQLEALAMQYEHPFEDLNDSLEDYVSYAYVKGIAAGVSASKFSPDSAVTGKTFCIFLLRAMGYGSDPRIADPVALAKTLGYTDDRFGDGSAKLTVKDGEEVLWGLLTKCPAGSTVSLISMLLRTGAVTAQQATEASFGATAAPVGSMTAKAAFEKFGKNLVVLTAYNKDGEEIAATTAAMIGEDVGVASLSDITGANSLAVTAKGMEDPVTAILAYSQETDLVFFRRQSKVENYFTSRASSGSELVNYALGESVMVLHGTTFRAPDGLVVINEMGSLVGITSHNSIISAEVPGDRAEMDVMTLGRTLWPKDMPGRVIDPTKPMVCLTFDDGPSRLYTPLLLDLLEEYGVVATFFECGYMLKAHPENLKRMEELGCEIGSHTYSHEKLINLTTEEIKKEMADTDALIIKEVGHGATIMRPPGGKFDDHVLEALQVPAIRWNVDTRDWEHKDADKTYNAVMSKENLDGSIVLMHSLYEPTLEACKRIIPELIAQGYQLVTVSEMAQYKGVDLQAHKVYYSFK